MSKERLKQIITDLSTSYDVNSMDDNDFYKAIIGIYKKQYHPLSLLEFEEHRTALWDQGIFAGPSPSGDSFLMYSHNLPPGKNVRFYLNAHDAESARKIIVSAVKELKDEKYRIKTIGHENYGYERYDNIVVYVNINNGVKYIADFLQDFSNKNKELFDNEIPFTTKKIAKGICYGVSVDYGPYQVLGYQICGCEKVSFNELHSFVLGLLFNEFREKNITDLDEKAELYSKALGQANFNQDNMHLILGIDDPLEDLVLTTVSE